MVEQNGGKKDFKKVIQNRCSSETKNSFEESHCLMFRFERENKKFVMATLYLKTEQEKQLRGRSRF